MNEFFDTIAAIATSPGKGSIAIVKLSGKEALKIAHKCFIKKDSTKLDFHQLPSRHTCYGYVIDATDGTIIDECILLVMKAPYSFTGEDVVEFQCHGGSISAYKIINTLFSLGARQASPGEFTLRAFLNQKIDLIQAEAVNALVNSTSDFLYKNALSQLKGDLSNTLQDIFKDLENFYLTLEAAVNFPEDVDFYELEDLVKLLKKLKDTLEKMANSYLETTPLREGIKAVIVGKPNVGKSTFLNKILDYERSIVTPHPGTTRDFIEEQINFLGIPLNIIDTAGVRETADPIEKIGIEKTLALISKADVIFLILDASTALTEEDIKLIELVCTRKNIPVFCLLNKIDIGLKINVDLLPPHFITTKISLKNGSGFDDFQRSFRKNIFEIYNVEKDKDFTILLPRHYDIIKEMISIINEALLSDLTSDKCLFTTKEVIRLYHKLLGKEIAPEDIDKIFSNFCIGK